MKLSVVVLVRNEEKNIQKCLESASFADELIVVDDNSSDQTVEIAKKCGARIFTNKLLDFASQRNFSLERVSGDWVLFLDADEIISPQLKSEILENIN